MGQSTRQITQDCILSYVSSYIALCKPKVVLLMLLAALMGMTAHVTDLSCLTVALGLLGIGCLASAGGIINHLTDQDLDHQMSRTQRRPLVQGLLQNQQALIFASVLISFGLVVLIWGVNFRTAWLTFISLIGYTFIYGHLLKPASPQNIVIGGLSGAMPPLLGWSVTHAHLSAEPWLMVLIIFLWTPAHFWALALYKKKDYATVNLPMLPITHGNKLTKQCIISYIVLTLLACLLAWLSGFCSWRFALAATLVNGWWLNHGIKLYRQSSGRQAWVCFKVSIIQLYAVFMCWIIDQVLWSI
ncbi:heme o synthase [Gammaproteobacteria bacterium]|nr:heme o synthase [Gammaproteobacteria bacterium]